MNPIKSFKSFCFLVMAVLIGIAGTAQVQTARNIAITPNSPGFYEYLPQGYNPSGSETYPLLVFIHGMGELGTNLSLVLRNGPPKLISQGKFPVSFTVNGQTHKFIVISPQFKSWPSSADVNNVINYAITNYKVNPNRVYLTGLSMGGGVTWEYAGYKSSNYPYTYGQRLAGIVPICGASFPDLSRARVITSHNIPVWATHNDGDPTAPVSYTNGYISGINQAPAPTPPAKKTIFSSTSHDAWSKTYDPNFRENGMNVYEWMLQYERGVNLPAAPNMAPSVSAGVDKIFNLPTNSTQLAGSATDMDGSITNISWTKISGPSQYSFSSPGSTVTTVSNLAAGTYTFRLTITDNKGAVAFDEVNVIVNEAMAPGDYRILIDMGTTNTASPDQWGNYWNNMNDGRPGVRVQNAKTTTNAGSGISLEVVNRLNGSWEAAGNTMGSGSSIGAVGDYPANATMDYTIAHSSVTNGRWKFTGLDPTKTYTVKFWGGRYNTSDTRIMQIKKSTESTWSEFNAVNNMDYNRAAIFQNITGVTEVIFDMKVKSGSQFGNLSVVDIKATDGQTAPANQAPVARAGNDATITLPVNSTTLNGSSSSDADGSITEYTWSKISGPAQFAFGNANSASTTVSNLVAGTYVFRLTVKDNGGKTSTDDVSVVVNQASGGGGTVISERILIDLGTTSTASPDGSGKYWNMMTDARPGVRVSNARNTENVGSGIGLEVINRINGNWDAATTGLSGGNSIGVVSEYPTSSTVDHAIAHNSTTSGEWKFTGLDPAKTYKIKFWGTRSASGPRIIQIKKTTESTWLEYDAANNRDYNRAAVFSSITGVTEVSFNIKVKSGSTFGHINVVDIETEGTVVTSSSVQSSGTTEVSATGVALYPNPFADRVVLQVNNAHQGEMKVTVSDVSGVLKKAFTFNKSQTSTQVYLSLGDLAAGSYIVQIRIGEWTDSKTIIKQ